MVVDSRPAAARPSTDSAEQYFDELFDLLSRRRRRYALACLMEHTEPVALSELAREVAVRENGTTAAEISDDRVRAVESSLYHSHIPKLAEVGVVGYDPERASVSLSGDPERIERLISLTPSGGAER